MSLSALQPCASHTPAISPRPPPPTAAAVLEALSSPLPLHRDRALLTVPSLPRPELLSLTAALPSLLTPSRWEVVAAGLLASRAVLAAPGLEASEKQALGRAVLAHAVNCVGDGEARVRTAAAELLGRVASVCGAEVWDVGGPGLCGVVEKGFKIEASDRLEEAGRVAGRDGGGERGVGIVHETEGWRGLETGLLAIAEVVRGCGAGVIAGGGEFGDVVGFVERGHVHENRFVREAGLKVMGGLVAACVEAGAADVLARVVEKLSGVLASGLEDNWSQVRYNASVVARKVMCGLGQEERRVHYALLLPRMCLNRHYVAEGVRVYSQDSWKNAIGADGRVYLVRYMAEVISFYESQCNADNHAVREAACQSFAEVATRLEPAAVKTFVPRVVDALVVCFKDESWPVRDHACSALAAVTAQFCTEVEATGRLSELFDLFYAHLADNISSVRENTAISIVKAARAFPISHPILGLAKMKESAAALLPSIASQAEKKFVPSKDDFPDPANRRDRDTGYGAAAKIARDNDADLHTGQVMYSCGSLAPKLRRGGGCMDHGFSRPKEPWEETDGGMKLWLRLAEAGKDGSVLAGELLPLIVDALKIASALEFAHSGQAQESFWTSIAGAARLVPREVWTTSVLTEAAKLAEKTGAGDHARAARAAKSAVMALRRSVGFDAYVEVAKAIREEA